MKTICIKNLIRANNKTNFLKKCSIKNKTFRWEILTIQNDTKYLVAYTTKDGLLSPVGKNTWTLAEDCSGNSWITTEFKLSQVELRSVFLNRCREIIPSMRASKLFSILSWLRTTGLDKHYNNVSIPLKLGLSVTKFTMPSILVNFPISLIFWINVI